MIRIKVKLKADDFFAFKMYHTFHSVAGVVRIVISMLFILTAVLTAGAVPLWETVLVAAIGFLNPIITPLIFKMQGNNVEKSEPERIYTFTDELITVNDGKQIGCVKWDQLLKAVWTRKSLLLYTTAYQALIIPCRYIENRKEELVPMMKNVTIIRNIRIHQ